MSYRSPISPPVVLGLSLVLLLSACHDAEPERVSDAKRQVHPVAQAKTVELKDVLETSPTHIIGISYPPELRKYPGLAAQARRYAEQARHEVVEAAKQRPTDDAGAGPYELSLEFKLKHESPHLVVLAVDGSTYTGGAHGLPMIQRWVWLPPEDRLLTATELFPRPDTWKTISTGVREQLQGAVAQRLDANNASAAERADAMRSAGGMIDGGTQPRPEDFAVFEPVMTADGKIGALRFVFPPYQVGAYADGMHTVELPAAQLVQFVNPAYRRLFEART